MNGFLDRLAARALGEAPRMQPRLRSHFEPDAGVLPGGPVEEIGEVAVQGTFESVSEGSRAESSPPGPLSHWERGSKTSRSGPQTAASPDLPLSPRERGPGGEDSARHPFEPPQSPEQVFEAPETEQSRLRRAPHPLAPSPTRPPVPPGEGEINVSSPAPTLALKRVVAPPLPADGRADGRGGRGVRGHEAAPPESVEPQPPRLRPRSALAEKLPTVEPDRRAPLPPAPEESEPSETVVHVSIGRIDVRAAQPPAPAVRPARPAGPRLTLTDYLKRREGRR